jgi:phosphate transport system substrate-binding protein
MSMFKGLRSSIACLCLASTLAQATPPSLAVLHIQGSNTMGAGLAPALVQGLFASKGLNARTEPMPGDNDYQVVAHAGRGPVIAARIEAHGTATGFAALATGQADLAAASRPIHPAEQLELYGTVEPATAGMEHVIGLDGVAVVVHRANPLRALTADELAEVFAGRITQWEQLGIPLGPIHLLARDNRSGTWETFRDLVLAPRRLTLASSARRLESSRQLSESVSEDAQAIGFIGLPYVHDNRALAISDGDTQAVAPTVDTVATEDYMLSRRLYFYTGPGTPSPWAEAMVRYAESDAGQRIVAEQGFIAQQIQAVKVQPAAGMPGNVLALARNGLRLTVNFRFAGASASLDSKAMADIVRLADYLQAHPAERQRVVLLGFGETRSEPERALLLSRLRAMTVRRELARRGIFPREVLGLGDVLPVASNTYESGRARNRRVEVWLQPGR